MAKHSYTYLALGDSYTIAEGLPLYESFPYQLVQLLRKQGVSIHAPEIIAKTGWTSFELAEHVLHMTLEQHYDFVTLAIGVNNQYRNLSPADYRIDFEFLIRKALHYTNEQPQKVLVLSIPDWGQTPFGHAKNPAKIAREINQFNEVNAEVSGRFHCQYIDITRKTGESGLDADMLASDKLHYSAKEYARWARDIADVIIRQV